MRERGQERGRAPGGSYSVEGEGEGERKVLIVIRR